MAVNMPKRGPGRPALGAEARVRPNVVKLSANEEAFLKHAAELADETLSEYLRSAGLERAAREKVERTR